MFQNISKDFEENSQNEFEDVKVNKKVKLKDMVRSSLRGQSILLYIIAFMLSGVTGNIEIGYSIFAISIFAAASSNGIPVGILYIITTIGTLMKYQTAGLLSYVLTSGLFIAMILIFKPKRILEEYQNEKQKLGKFVFLSVLLGQVIEFLWKPFLIYDLLIAISASFIAYIFYKIFSKSIIVVNDIRTKKAFALEEVMGAVLMVSIAGTVFGKIEFLGLNISNIISILLVLVLGWKNGILVGTTSGVTVGVVLGIITGAEPILIAAFALSGLIAGILSRFGKIGVIVGFIAGNLLLTYVYNGAVVELIHFKEILVASLALILIPNKLEINITDLFGKENYLEEGARYRLEGSKETAEKLEDVSEVIQKMSDTYKEGLEEKDVFEDNRELFIDILQEKVQDMKENILYDDIMSADEIILKDTYQYLTLHERVNRDGLLKIFESHNNYIVGFDSYDISSKIEKDIIHIIKAMNEAYEETKKELVVKTKVSMASQNVSKQLEGVSHAINSIAQEIKQEEKQQFEKEKKEIFALCKQRQVNLLDLEIKQESTGRYVIKTYLNTCKKEEIIKCPTEKIEEILSKVLKEDIRIEQENCGIKQEQNFCHQTYLSNDKYSMQIGIAKTNKDGQTVSGDSSIQIKLKDGKYLIAISDGMGNGPEARKSSQIAVKMLRKIIIEWIR